MKVSINRSSTKDPQERTPRESRTAIVLLIILLGGAVASVAYAVGLPTASYEVLEKEWGGV